MDNSVVPHLDLATPFIAVCPFCKKMKFRTTLKKYGQFAECRQCHKPFILVPDDPSSIPANLLATVTKEATAKPLPPEKYATPEVLVPPTTPLPATPREVVPSVERTGHASSTNAPFAVALISVILFGSGILLTQIPYGRFIGVAFCLIGVVLAGLSLLGLEKRQWIGYGGVGLNLIGLLLVLALPDWLGGLTWFPPTDENAFPTTPMAVEKNSGKRQQTEWVDAEKAVWEHADVRVEVASVIVGPPEGKPKDSSPKRDPVLKIALKVTNIGVARAIELNAWTAGSPAPGGILLGTTPNPPGTIVKIMPGKSAEVVLNYPPPAGTPTTLHLELQGTSFGDTETVRFEIPGAMIRKTQTGRSPTFTP